MQSFRTELENPIVEKEIIQLEKNIRQYRTGELPDEKFRSLRLARGIYGQRQPGVQMVRIKLPFGRVTFKQLLKIADISDEYASKNLHLTTRQDIQIHFVSLDKTPELWAKLAEDDMTLREACGNTVRNVTASPAAGIDPNELFDVSSYARTTFEYFVRNPICVEMGRKFKIAFSSSDQDTSFAYGNDFGFIPRIKVIDGKETRGFKVVLGGGLGAQPMLAHEILDFIAEDQFIPYIEAGIRVFDRHGERTNRNKARFKYLIQKLGLDTVLELIEKEKVAIKSKRLVVDRELISAPEPPSKKVEAVDPVDPLAFEIWKQTNIFEQKQKGYFGVYVNVQTGDISTEKARKLIKGVIDHVADDIRITPDQNLLFKFVRPESFSHLYNLLHTLGFAKPGHNSTADITTCPGTDSCNLGISNSTEMARVLENYIHEFHSDFIYETNLKIKISGCMNSCGQHGIAHIGFHGSSLKAGSNVVPAAQVLLGGGTIGAGVGRVAERVIKVPTKRVIQVVDLLLSDFKSNKLVSENFHDYYDRKTKDYFYRLLKPLTDLSNLTADELIDWGKQEKFSTAIGVGECAGVIIDLVATLLYDAQEKIEFAELSFANKQYADAIYHSYSAFIWSAKALLLDRGVGVSTQIAVLEGFGEHFGDAGFFESDLNFHDFVLRINKNQPGENFARTFLHDAKTFVTTTVVRREELKLVDQ